MSKKTNEFLVAVIFLALITTIVLTGRPYGVTQALGEYFRPTTLTMMQLPKACIQVNDVPPPILMRVVESQMNFYHSTLQKVVICRTEKKFPRMEPHFTEAAFDDATRKVWLPLYVGCCTYQFRRHFAVVVADGNENGTLILEAALIESRWDFLRLNWNKKRSSWS